MSASATLTVQDIEVFAGSLDVKHAAEIYKEHGALVVRGLMKPYIEQVRADIEAAAAQALALIDKARKIPEGWAGVDGTLFLPAPKNYGREKQIMVLACTYTSSAAFFRSAFDPKTIALASAVLGPNVELFLNGQCLYKEPVGGHAKHLHQDAAYFEHRYEGPFGMLNYAVPTDLNNGALHVIPGTHRMGVLPHIDTSSHLGLDEHEWPWERALAICGEPGDSIFFHVKTVHGSKSNFSKAPRPVFIHRYRRADDYVVVSATSTENRANAEQRVKEAKKENQVGFMVCGRRTYDEGRMV